jgi:hypothetical protein
MELTVERVRQHLDYCPKTGVFRLRNDAYNLSKRAGEPVGAKDGQGYLRLRIDGKRYRLHRLAWLHHYGELPPEDIDHINGDRSDNRIANLRAVSRRENLQNAVHRATGATGMRGVTKRKGKYAAQIVVDYKHLYLGRYDTPEEAHEVYMAAKRRLHSAPGICGGA